MLLIMPTQIMLRIQNNNQHLKHQINYSLNYSFIILYYIIFSIDLIYYLYIIYNNISELLIKKNIKVCGDKDYIFHSHYQNYYYQYLYTY